jgi:SAM-dependent methyltransferase
MTGSELERRFAPVAHALRDGIIEHYRDKGEQINHAAGLRTLDTNSLLAAARGMLLLNVLAAADRAVDLEGARVVDLGCGFGALSLFFATGGATVIGIDPNAERLTVGAIAAREFALPVTFQRGWTEDLVLPDASADLVVINNSLCYIVPRAERRRAVAHVRRILIPGGTVVLRNPSRSWVLDPFTGLPLVHQLPPKLAQALTRRHRPPRSPVRLRTAGGLKRELRRGGFSDVKHVRIDRRWWLPPRYQHHVARA